MDYEERKNRFVKDMKDKNIIILSEYTNARTRIKLECLSCGTIFSKVVQTCLSQEILCPKCRKLYLEKERNIKVKKELEIELKKLNKPNFIVVNYPKRMTDNIDMLHMTCGHMLKISLYNLKKNKNNDKGCKYCSGKYTYSPEEIKSYLKMYADDYRYIKSKIINKHLMVTLEHIICGRIYTIQYNQFLRGKRCSKCLGGVRKSTEEFSKQVDNLGNGNYVLLSSYKNSHSKVKMKHLNCSTCYWVSPTSFLSGARCPNCNQSHGELLIGSILKSKGISYVPQKKFADCKYHNLLPFDFYISDRNMLIEYDGIQHFKPITIFGSDEGLKIRHIRDNIKNEYAINNDIRLIRIPYVLNDINVKLILNDLLDSGKINSKYVIS